MHTIVIYNPSNCRNEPLSFLDILLNETLIEGTVYIPKACLKKVSTINHRLPAKQIYEFILRLACVFPVCIADQLPDQMDSCMVLQVPEIDFDEAGFVVDCYIAARYKKVLLAHQIFDSAVNSILLASRQLGCENRMIPILEEMLQENGRYPYYFQGSQPFLIYTGDPFCFQILSVFAENLGKSLERNGYLVEYFDVSKEDYTAAFRYIDKSFQAVIGMQSYMFSVRLINEQFLHDRINGPKYNFVFDHPVRFQNHLKATPQNLTILTLDQDYEAFMRKYYPPNVRFLPPGGIENLQEDKTHIYGKSCIKDGNIYNKNCVKDKRRIYDVTFIASYNDIKEAVSVQLLQMDRPMRFLVNRFWLHMRKNLTAETSLLLALKDYGYVLLDEDFTELLEKFQKFVLYMASRYRFKLVKTLVSSGVKVDVFGKSWSTCPLRDNPNMIWHDLDLSTEECLDVWQHSKFSLNTMSWHKNALTERIANSMLQKAVVITDRNPYLESQFQDGQDIIYYDLDQMDKLPARIHRLLQSPERISEISENGYQKAAKYHTWDCRAKELIQIAEQDAAHICNL